MINFKRIHIVNKDMMISLKFMKQIIKFFRIMSLTFINKIRFRINLTFKKTMKFQNKYSMLICIMQ